MRDWGAGKYYFSAPAPDIFLAAPAPDYWPSLPKDFFFFLQLSKAKPQKKHKTSKTIVFPITKIHYSIQNRAARVQPPYAFHLLAGLRNRPTLTGSGSGSKEPKTPGDGSGSPDLVLCFDFTWEGESKRRLIIVDDFGKE